LGIQNKWLGGFCGGHFGVSAHFPQKFQFSEFAKCLPARVTTRVAGIYCKARAFIPLPQRAGGASSCNKHPRTRAPVRQCANGAIFFYPIG